MPGPIAALDADVLVPIIACDLLLIAFDHGLYEPVVSITVLDEVERALLADFPELDPAAIRYRVDAMRDALEHQIVDAEAADVPATINAKDRHVVAAARAGKATILVTNDRRLRTEVGRECSGLRPLCLDELALELWNGAPSDASAVVDALIAKRNQPRVSRQELVEKLRGHVPSFADQASQASTDPPRA